MATRQLKKNTILVVGLLPASAISGFREFNEVHGGRYKFVIFHDKPRKALTEKQLENLGFFDGIHKVNFDSTSSLTKALDPYKDKLCAVISRSDANVPRFQKVIPLVEHLRVPSVESLEWATHKLLMRRKFNKYDPTITPKYRIVTDTSKKTIKAIEEKVGYPLVIKPTGLASSLLVTVVYHRNELEEGLQKVFRKIKKIYKDIGGRGEPAVLVEEFMEGQMYSVDAYINNKGQIYFCPLVHIKTGKDTGFDDFFGYLQMTPTKLSERNIKLAEDVATKAIRALGLQNITAHIELMKTEGGWKVIEVGPRVGGFRDALYGHAFGIKHAANDLRIRLGYKPKLYKKPKGHAAAMKFYAKKEGTITSLKGIKLAQQLNSFQLLTQKLSVGERARFARHGGKGVFDIILFSPDRSQLLADIRRLEKMIKIKVN